MVYKMLLRLSSILSDSLSCSHALRGSVYKRSIWNGSFLYAQGLSIRPHAGAWGRVRGRVNLYFHSIYSLILQLKEEGYKCVA